MCLSETVHKGILLFILDPIGLESTLNLKKQQLSHASLFSFSIKPLPEIIL